MPPFTDEAIKRAVCEVLPKVNESMIVNLRRGAMIEGHASSRRKLLAEEEDVEFDIRAPLSALKFNSAGDFQAYVSETLSEEALASAIQYVSFGYFCNLLVQRCATILAAITNEHFSMPLQRRIHCGCSLGVHEIEMSLDRSYPTVSPSLDPTSHQSTKPTPSILPKANLKKDGSAASAASSVK